MERRLDPWLRAVIVLTTLAALAGCGGSGAPATTGAPPPATQSAMGTLTLSIPHAGTSSAAAQRSAAFVSPSATSVQITVNALTPTVVDVSSTSSLCTNGTSSRTCAVPVSAPTGAAKISIAIFDGPNATGKMLGSGAAGATVVAGTPFSVTIAVVPVAAGFANPVVTYATGTSFVVGTPGTATATVTVLDPDGNVIPTAAVPPFTAPVTLSTNDPNVTVSPTTVTSPTQTITLTYNGSTSVGTVVTLTASAGGATIATAQLGFGTNRVVNGDAETDTGAPDNNTIVAPTGWKTTGQFTAVQYGASGGFPDSTSPRPSDAGKNFFAGGNVTPSTATQTINLASLASVIDTGTHTYLFSAWLGGYANQDDNAMVTLQFQNATGASLGSLITIGPVTAAMRNNATGFVYQSTSGNVPTGARSAVVTITSTRLQGTYNDGYADDISLVL